MNRTIFRTTAMAAGLALGGSALAASSVSMYGLADAGGGHLRYSYAAGGNQARFSQNGFRNGYLRASRLGIKGSEDLGGGTQALFNFETEVDLRDGDSSNPYWKRYAYVGVSNASFGTFTLGRQKDFNTFVTSDTVRGLGRKKRAFGGAGGRRDGLLKYVSPKLGGFRAGAAYARETGKVKRFYSLGVQYQNGPFSAFGVYHDQRLAADTYAARNWMIGGAYDFKVVQLVAAYGQDRNGKLNTAGDVKSGDFGANKPMLDAAGLGNYNQRGFKSKNYFLGMDAPLGPGTLGVSWTHSSSNLDRFGYATKAQDIVGAVYIYDLSKRTSLYAYGAYGKGIAYVRGLKAREAGIGLRHKF